MYDSILSSKQNTKTKTIAHADIHRVLYSLPVYSWVITSFRVSGECRRRPAGALRCRVFADRCVWPAMHDSSVKLKLTLILQLCPFAFAIFYNAMYI